MRHTYICAYEHTSCIKGKILEAPLVSYFIGSQHKLDDFIFVFRENCIGHPSIQNISNTERLNFFALKLPCNMDLVFGAFWLL